MTNYSRLEELLDSAGYSDGPIKKTVTELFYVLDSHEPDPESRRAIGQLFNSLVDNPEMKPITGRWAQFKLGETRVGSTVRVKRDAYDTEGGKRHNGLVGCLVAVRGGRCIVQYIGRSDGVGHYHPPHSLEVLV